MDPYITEMAVKSQVANKLITPHYIITDSNFGLLRINVEKDKNFDGFWM